MPCRFKLTALKTKNCCVIVFTGVITWECFLYFKTLPGIVLNWERTSLNFWNKVSKNIILFCNFSCETNIPMRPKYWCVWPQLCYNNVMVIVLFNNKINNMYDKNYGPDVTVQLTYSQLHFHSLFQYLEHNNMRFIFLYYITNFVWKKTIQL